MNVHDVDRAIKEILRTAADDEMAHTLEDELYEKLLGAIAKGECDDPRECARVALTSKSVNFGRWCA